MLAPHQLRGDPSELGHLQRFIARRGAGDEEADALAREAEAWITARLGKDYPGPGQPEVGLYRFRNRDLVVKRIPIMDHGSSSPPSGW